MSDLSGLEGARWLNPPEAWTQDGAGLAFATGLRTDFWRDTLYGFRRDSGHALLRRVAGDFTAYLSFDADYQALYDQAGILLRRDAATWIKAGIEQSDGVANLSVVVTRRLSDWSTMPLPGRAGPQRLRVTRIGAAVVLQARDARNRWQLLRVCPCPAGPIGVGPMACSPERGGLSVRVTEFRLTPPVDGALHDESPAD